MIFRVGGMSDTDYGAVRNFVGSLNEQQRCWLTEYLEGYVTPNKQEQMAQVLRHRTRHLSVVLENIHQAHNASAVIRSCECFGVQDLHVIENNHPLRFSMDVTMGGCKWIDLHVYPKRQNNTSMVLEQLKERGYKIAATSLREGSMPLSKVPLDEPLAVCIGEEDSGLSDAAHDAADYLVQIPMYGFTQSYNLSVSAALSLSCLRERLEDSQIDWRLEEEDRKGLYLNWLIKTVNRGLVFAQEMLERERV